MRLTRIFVDEPLGGRSAVTLGGTAARHGSVVLRLKAGDALRVFDGRGGEYLATVRDVRRTAIGIELGTFIAEGPAAPVEIALWQGVAKGERMDFTVQKATELGVAAIVPVFTQRSVVRLPAERARRRLRHWQALAASAAEQSGRTLLPVVHEPQPLGACLAGAPGNGLRIVLDPAAPDSLVTLASRRVAHLTLLTGPEGGFDESELLAATAAGFRRHHLGPRVLRTETAAIAALGIAQALWGDLQ